MKRKLFSEKNVLVSLLEYKLEHREEQKRLNREAKREMDSSLLFIGM